MKAFINFLKQKGIYFEKQGIITLIASNNGDVDLRSLTSLSENVKFENHGSVDLRSLTSLPENVKFENHGYVNLESLTSLSENVKFENHGSVYLESLTSLPENVKFENHGDVDLRSLTSLPENVKFENHGSVYLESLTGRHIYQNSEYEFKSIDGSTMIIISSRIKHSVKIRKALYFAGGPINNFKSCFVANKDVYFAHGETEEEAIEDVMFKFLRNNFDKKSVIETIAKRGTVTSNDYRLLTGACRLGVKLFKEKHNITEKELPLTKVLEIIKGEYGSEEFKGFFI